MSENPLHRRSISTMSALLLLALLGALRTLGHAAVLERGSEFFLEHPNRSLIESKGDVLSVDQSELYPLLRILLSPFSFFSPTPRKEQQLSVWKFHIDIQKTGTGSPINKESEAQERGVSEDTHDVTKFQTHPYEKEKKAHLPIAFRFPWSSRFGHSYFPRARENAPYQMLDGEEDHYMSPKDFMHKNFATGNNWSKAKVPETNPDYKDFQSQPEKKEKGDPNLPSVVPHNTYLYTSLVRDVPTNMTDREKLNWMKARVKNRINKDLYQRMLKYRNATELYRLCRRFLNPEISIDWQILALRIFMILTLAVILTAILAYFQCMLSKKLHSKQMRTKKLKLHPPPSSEEIMANQGIKSQC